MNLRDDDATVQVDGSIRYEWAPKPRLVVNAKTPTDAWIFFGSTELEAPSLRLRAPCWLAEQSNTRHGMSYRGWLKDPVHVGGPQQVTELRFVLVNFTLRVPFSVALDGWTLIVHPVPDLERVLRLTTEARAHAGTHIASLRMSDGASFSPEVADDVRNVLYWTLAFATGHHVGMALTTGFDSSDRPVWREWRETIVDRCAPRLSWLEPRDASSFTSLLAVLHRAWGSELRASIPTALGFYLQANTSSSPETALVIGCAGLELVSWLTLVEGGPRLTRDGFDKLRLSDRVRLTLGMANAQRGIPAELSELASYATENNWTDGPHAVSELRNAVIHPKSRAKAFGAPVAARLEATRLLLWYFDVLVLKLIGYEGSYLPHAVGATGAQVGALGPVPWASQ